MPVKFQQATAVGALVAAAALVAILLAPAPVGRDHFAILTGLSSLSGEQRLAYQHSIAVNFSFDNFYLMGHIAMWLGLASLLRRRVPLLAVAVLVFGLGGAALDFLENAMRWTYTQDLVRGMVIDVPAMRVWSIVYGLSYIAIFVAATLTALGIFSVGRWGELLAFVALAGAALLPGYYFDGYDFTYYWLILWHLTAAGCLWVTASQLACRSDLSPGPAPQESK